MTLPRLEKEVKSFLLHIDNYLQRPEYSIVSSDPFASNQRSLPKVNPAPEIICTVFDAAHGTNVSLTEAWNMPIGQAYIAQAMHLREKGMLVDFLNIEEREFQAQLKEHWKKK